MRRYDPGHKLHASKPVIFYSPNLSIYSRYWFLTPSVRREVKGLSELLLLLFLGLLVTFTSDILIFWKVFK